MDARRHGSRSDVVADAHGRGSPVGRRTLLLVDDEENILRSLKRLLRRDGHTIVTANSGESGLELLEKHPVGVIVSDQRMPHMDGAEFLAKVAQRHPDTVRIILSGYTDLETVTEAINRGAIYKFLTKPWDDELLRKNIAEAFHLFELRQENERLTLELRAINQQLEERVEEKTRALKFNLRALHVAQDVLQELPIAVFGISEGCLILANQMAEQLLAHEGTLMLGEPVDQALPEALCAIYRDCLRNEEPVVREIEARGGRFRGMCKLNDGAGAHEGHILTLRRLNPC